MTAPLRYNPQPPTEVYRVAVFNPTQHGVLELETVRGLSLDARKIAAQNLADQVPPGYTVQVFSRQYTVGRSTPQSTRIIWE